MEHVDVVIVGAGISGVSAAWHLETRCPHKRYTILEARNAIGGTWDLYRYPGIRSDSDMYTLGFVFKPWLDARAIADGSTILRYINEGRRRARHPRAGPLRPPGDGGKLVERRGGVDRASRARRTQRPHLLQHAADVRWLLQVRRPLPAAVGRHGSIRGPRHPSPALARGSRLPGQEGDRDRIGGDGDDPRAGNDDGRRRPRHHGAAVADLRRLVAESRQDRPLVAPLPARTAGLCP